MAIADQAGLKTIQEAERTAIPQAAQVLADTVAGVINGVDGERQLAMAALEPWRAEITQFNKTAADLVAQISEVVKILAELKNSGIEVHGKLGGQQFQQPVVPQQPIHPTQQRP